MRQVTDRATRPQRCRQRADERRKRPAAAMPAVIEGRAAAAPLTAAPSDPLLHSRRAHASAQPLDHDGIAAARRHHSAVVARPGRPAAAALTVH